MGSRARLGLALVATLAACAFDRPSGGIDAAGDDAIDDAATADGAAADGATADGGAADAPVDAVPSICSTAGLVCPGSSPMMLACGTGCWAGCTNGTPVIHATAATACAAWGGELARLDSLAENDCVAAALGGAVWLGLVQAPGQTDETAGWSWSGDGLTPGYLHWAVGQPNDGDGIEDATEQCAYRGTAGNWQDDPCTSTYARFACRRP